MSGRTTTTPATKLAADLRAGDTYRTAPAPHGVPVTILRDQETDPNRFGLPWFRFWARRDDTGQEGWVSFGPRGRVWI